jgi:hypothetical protein
MSSGIENRLGVAVRGIIASGSPRYATRRLQANGLAQTPKGILWEIQLLEEGKKAYSNACHSQVIVETGLDAGIELSKHFATWLGIHAKDVLLAIEFVG